MSQYGMIIDLEKCVGCHACTIACRAEWDIPVGNDWSDRKKERCWVKRLGPSMTPEGLAHTYYTGLCNHCDQPVCVDVCPVDPVEMVFTDIKTGTTKKLSVTATWKDPFNGSVQVDKERCIGCGACADSCPYLARYIDDTLDAPKADKCTFCVERLAEGLSPACVQTCLADARIFGDITDQRSALAAYVGKGAKGLESAAVKIGPNVRYYGKKRDILLLEETSSPQELAQANPRRNMLRYLAKSTCSGVKALGLLGLAGTLSIRHGDDKGRAD